MGSSCQFKIQKEKEDFCRYNIQWFTSQHIEIQTKWLPDQFFVTSVLSGNTNKQTFRLSIENLSSPRCMSFFCPAVNVLKCAWFLEMTIYFRIVTSLSFLHCDTQPVIQGTRYLRILSWTDRMTYNLLFM